MKFQTVIWMYTRWWNRRWQMSEMRVF